MSSNGDWLRSRGVDVGEFGEMHPTMEEGVEMVRRNVYRLPDDWQQEAI